MQRMNDGWTCCAAGDFWVLCHGAEQSHCPPLKLRIEHYQRHVECITSSNELHACAESARAPRNAEPIV
jgi:hypothetical protein